MYLMNKESYIYSSKFRILQYTTQSVWDGDIRALQRQLCEAGKLLNFWIYMFSHFLHNQALVLEQSV